LRIVVTPGLGFAFIGIKARGTAGAKRWRAATGRARRLSAWHWNSASQLCRKANAGRRKLLLAIVQIFNGLRNLAKVIPSNIYYQQKEGRGQAWTRGGRAGKNTLSKPRQYCVTQPRGGNDLECRILAA
jgi:hypothetical protein